MTNEELYNAAIEAITNLFSDQSVSRSEARRNLDNLQQEINILIDVLEE